jgi:hypothetical protein
MAGRKPTGRTDDPPRWIEQLLATLGLRIVAVLDLDPVLSSLLSWCIERKRSCPCRADVRDEPNLFDTLQE